LSAALDEVVAVGLAPADHRPAAEFLAWSAVHGLAIDTGHRRTAACTRPGIRGPPRASAAGRRGRRVERIVNGQSSALPGHRPGWKATGGS
jgi:hypothetical protein